MRTDGQLYTDDAAPPSKCEIPLQKKQPIERDELLILGLLFLLMTDKGCKDMPLMIALIYILL